MTRKEVEKILTAWGCPEEYRRTDIDHRADIAPELVPYLQTLAKKTNWYPEMSIALAAMTDAGDVGAIRKWGMSDAWDEIALEASINDDYETLRGWVDNVRYGFERLARAIDNR